jgi:phage repressor protein C with HTH and peptisase S24 domain
MADVADPDALTRPPAKRAPRARMWRRGYQTIGPEELPADGDRHYVPIINRVAAGISIDTAESESGPPGWANEYVAVSDPPVGAIALRVVGHSMEPMYAPDDILIVDPAAEPRSGEPAVVVYRTDGAAGDVEACVKIWRPGRAGAVGLASINPQFPVIRLAAGSVLRAFRVGEHLPLLVDATETTP